MGYLSPVAYRSKLLKEVV
ncbi:hypothetical protein ACTQ46_10905 [Gallicola sp. Sow4_E12]